MCMEILENPLEIKILESCEENHFGCSNSELECHALMAQLNDSTETEQRFPGLLVLNKIHNTVGTTSS